MASEREKVAGLMRRFAKDCFEVVRAYHAAMPGPEDAKYYVHFRCTSKEYLDFVLYIAESSNNPVMIRRDEEKEGQYQYTLAIYHNSDILVQLLEEHHQRNGL